MIGFIVALALQAQAAAPVLKSSLVGPSDVEACATLRKIAEDTTRELPIMVDAITRTDGMSVICSLRSFTVNKFLNVDLSAFRRGWEARKLAQWNQIICRNEAFAPLQKRGWRFTQNLTFKSGERFEQDASCS